MKRSASNCSRAFAACALISFSIFAAAGTVDGQAQKQPAAAPDIKIRQKMTMSAGGGTGMETVMYVKGSRMRSEMASTGMAMITVRQCDLNRTIMINDKNRTYLITPDSANAADGGASASVPGANSQQSQPRRGGVVTITSTITDTGERKEMFGFTARRIKTSMVKEASPDACDKSNAKVET